MIEKFVSVDTIGGLMLNLFMIAGLAALGEELLFRSIIQTSLIKICKNAHVGILIASAIFSFIHFEFYGFVPRLILGMLLGYMFYFSGSIWIPMLMHFLNNGTVVLIYFLNNKGITNIDVDTFGQTSIPVLIVSIVVMIALFLFSIKYSYKERTIAGN
jgi:membrane protease YdiL (CAAX protease family)